MLFIKPKKLTYREGFVVKKTIVFLLLTISFSPGQSLIKVKLKNGTTVDGEFVGTYMEHVHLLIGANINYFNCDDIQAITESGYVNVFEYDCSKNTVTSDILFPPQLNPMTGEWERIIPDVFDPKKRKVLAREEQKKEEKLAKVEKRPSDHKEAQESSLQKNNLKIEKVPEEQLEKNKKVFQEVNYQKTKSDVPSLFSRNDKEKTHQDRTKKNENSFLFSSEGSNKSTSSFSENEIRLFIKREVRKEIRKTLPYEIKKHKEENRNKILQNIFLGCGAWFLFMIMLS